MDEGKLRPIFADQIAGCDWAAGVSKDDLLAALHGYPSFREMVGLFVADGTYSSPDEVMGVIPEQAWQDAQGGVWRGGEIGDIDAMHSHFREGRVGQGTGTPSTPGVGHSPADEPSQATGGV